MQDGYTGDIGDFGKYSLLRNLTRDDLRLGVIWYLNGKQEKNADGRFVQYLCPLKTNSIRPADPLVYDALQDIVKRKNRRVSAIRESAMFRKDAVFCEEKLDSVLSPERSPDIRRSGRESWFENAVTKTTDSDVVFLDPDNGLEVQSSKPSSTKVAKYVATKEIQKLADRHASIVLYQHVTRVGNVTEQVQNALEQLKELSRRSTGWAVSFHAYSVRIYLILPSEKHSAMLQERCVEFVSDPDKQRVFKLQTHAI
jgi:hypothetical protein